MAPLYDLNTALADSPIKSTIKICLDEKMLCFGKVSPKDLSLRIDADAALVQKIFNSYECQLLLSDVIEHGIRDPLLVFALPDKRLLVETGGQRTLIARHLQLPFLWAFIAYDSGVFTNSSEFEVIQNTNDIIRRFHDPGTRTLVDILGYLQTGRISLHHR